MFFKKKGPTDEAPPPAQALDGTAPAADEEDEQPAGLAPVATTATEDIEYPSGLKLGLLLSSVFISMFLVSLDRLIISTAIPQITDDFHSVTDIGWYGSAYLLTSCAFQLLFGKLYTFFSIKAVFLATIFLFELGSAICGAAPTSDAFIVGRAIAGLGSAGIFSGVIIVIVYAVPLHKRPLYQGLFGAVFGVSSVIGPLLGGAFTSKVTWRWCFYINLPFGAVAMAFIFFLLKIPDRPTTKIPLVDKLKQLDFLGLATLLPGVVCLLLALQWGGLTYAWSDGRVIALLVLAGVLLVSFVLIQIFKPDTATVPPRIFVQRSIAAGVWVTFCIGSQMMIFVYFIPIWFQAIKGVSAVDSGIRMLPMVLPMVAASIITGVLTARVGYYTPFMIVGNCIIAIGAGLLTTFQVGTPEGQWVGYQVLYGWGVGNTFQAPNLAAQTVLPRVDVPIGSSLMFFSQLLGGAIFISVGQNVLNNQLLNRLEGLPGFDPSLITSNGATTIISQLPDSIKGAVLEAYNDSLRVVFQVGLVMACVGIFGSAAMEWRSVKKNLPKKPDAESAAAAAAATAEGAVPGPEGQPDEKVARDSESEDFGAVAAEGEQEKAAAPDLEKETARSTASTAVAPTPSALDEEGHVETVPATGAEAKEATA